MLKGLVLVIIAISAFGCVSTRQRMPSSMPTTLADYFQDTIVAYCSPDKVVVFHDPNYCGRTTAQNKSCTELPPYTSDLLSVTHDGVSDSYIDKDGEELFQLRPMSDGTFKLIANGEIFKAPITIKEDRLSEQFFNNLCP